MGYAQDLIDEIILEEEIKKKKEKDDFEEEVSKELLMSIEQELSGKLNYYRSAQRYINNVK